MARLYADENFPLPVVDMLRRLGHNVLTVRESGRAGIGWPDEGVLEFARQERRSLVTLNRKHFIRLHERGAIHAGIVACTFDLDFQRQANRIDELISLEPTLEGKLIRVNRPPDSIAGQS